VRLVNDIMKKNGYRQHCEIVLSWFSVKWKHRLAG
jgi:hypothetical protein